MDKKTLKDKILNKEIKAAEQTKKIENEYTETCLIPNFIGTEYSFSFEMNQEITVS